VSAPCRGQCDGVAFDLGRRGYHLMWCPAHAYCIAICAECSSAYHIAHGTEETATAAANAWVDQHIDDHLTAAANRAAIAASVREEAQRRWEWEKTLRRRRMDSEYRQPGDPVFKSTATPVCDYEDRRDRFIEKQRERALELHRQNKRRAAYGLAPLPTIRRTPPPTQWPTCTVEDCQGPTHRLGGSATRCPKHHAEWQHAAVRSATSNTRKADGWRGYSAWLWLDLATSDGCRRVPPEYPSASVDRPPWDQP